MCLADCSFFFSSRRRHTRSVSAFLLNRSSDLEKAQSQEEAEQSKCFYDARYGFRCCHLKNIWTAPLPPETELSRQMTTSTTSIDIMGLQAAYANLHTDRSEERRVGKECRSRWPSAQKKKINTLKNILINKLAFENIDDLQLPLL